MSSILFISNFLGNGGAGRVISILADYFSHMGLNVIVAQFSYAGYSYPLTKQVNQITLKVDSGARGVKKKKQRVAAIRNLLKQHQGATVIAFEYFVNMETIVASWGCNNRIIVSERNDPAQINQRLFLNSLRNVLYRHCNLLVCQTPDAKSYFPAKVQAHSVVIPNPIMSDLPTPFLGTRRKEIVNFCRLEKQKNLPLLVDAFALFLRDYPDYKLLIYGDGKEKDSIISYIAKKRMQEKIKVHNAIRGIHEQIKGCSMFVSSSDYEGLSNSMLEAMAIGLPTICTDCPCGGARMVIQDGVNGLLTPVGDAIALCSAMKRVTENSSLANRLSAEGTKIREKLSAESICKQWVQNLE